MISLANIADEYIPAFCRGIKSAWPTLETVGDEKLMCGTYLASQWNSTSCLQIE
jgi:hypothetical protein